MNSKVVISGVSLILVVGVAIGVVVVVNKKDSDPQIAAQQKRMKVMCEGTEDPQLCHETLSTVKGNTSDPKVYIAAGVEATMKSVIQALNMSDKLKVEHGDKDPGIKMALDDCKDLIQFALDSIESSVNLVNNQNIQSMYDQSPDFRNWLSAIISYQESCTDGLNNETNGEKEIKEKLNTGSLDEMGKLTGIVLDIVTNLSTVLESFDLKLNLNPSSRRLLQVDSEGLPTWFSGADRKLLAQVQKGAAAAPNAVVAKDGSGKFKSIKEAINAYPANLQGRYVIYVKTGVYDESILIPKKSANILIYGDGPGKTVVTGRKNFVDGVKTMQTATFGMHLSHFISQLFLTTSIPYYNSSSPKQN